MHAGWHSDVDRWNGNLYGGGHASLVIESDLSPSPTSTISSIWYQPDIASRPWRMAASIIINCKAETTRSLSYCIYSSQRQRINSLTNSSLAVISSFFVCGVVSGRTADRRTSSCSFSSHERQARYCELRKIHSLMYTAVCSIDESNMYKTIAEFIYARMRVGGTKCAWQRV